MQTQPLRTTLILSALFTVVVVGFVSFTSSQDLTPLGFLLNALVIFLIVFSTMRLTNRVTTFMVNRFGRQPEQGERARVTVTEPTTSRPEHVQRRRARRRQRGRRRSGRE